MEKEMAEINIQKLLDIDPVAEAEKLIGGGTLEDETVGMTACVLQSGLSNMKERILRERDDTVFSNDLERYLRILKEEGFEEVLRVPFSVRRHYYATVPFDEAEAFYIFAHRDGMVMAFDTSGGARVNAAQLYFEIRPFVKGKFPLSDCSGGFLRERAAGSEGNYYNAPLSGVFAGHYDAREALRYHIKMIRAAGSFVNPWTEKDKFLWFCHHGDEAEVREGRVERDEYSERTGRRRMALPQWVREMMNQ